MQEFHRPTSQMKREDYPKSKDI